MQNRLWTLKSLLKFLPSKLNTTNTHARNLSVELMTLTLNPFESIGGGWGQWGELEKRCIVAGCQKKGRRSRDAPCLLILTCHCCCDSAECSAAMAVAVFDPNPRLLLLHHLTRWRRASRPRRRRRRPHDYAQVDTFCRGSVCVQQWDDVIEKVNDCDALLAPWDPLQTSICQLDVHDLCQYSGEVDSRHSIPTPNRHSHLSLVRDCVCL